MKKRILKIAAVLSALLLTFAAAMPLSAAAGGITRENDAVVLRFDSPKQIARIIDSTYGLTAGHLDRSLECRFFCAPGLFTVSLDKNDRFSADEYRFVKIKYFANTLSKSTIIYFATETEPEYNASRSVTFDAGRNRIWRDKVLDLGKLSGNWKGTISSLRFDVNTGYSKGADEYVFIEYIAFFRTEEEANAFGGISDEQKNGTDLITRYSEGYRTSRIDGITYDAKNSPSASDTTPDSAADTPQETAGPDKTSGTVDTKTAVLIIAAAVIMSAGCVILIAVKSRRKNGGKA